MSKALAALSAILVCIVGGVGFAPVASADQLGDVIVTPGQGNSGAIMTLTSEGPCQEPASYVNGVLTGPGIPDTGLVVLSTTQVGFSVSERISSPTNNTIYQNALLLGLNDLNGVYTLRMNCTNYLAQTFDFYATTLVFTGPTDGPPAQNLLAATYVVKPALGAVEPYRPAPADAPTAAPAPNTQAGVAEQPGTGSAETSPAPRNPEASSAPAGPAPESTGGAAESDVAANQPSAAVQTEDNFPWLLGAVTAAVLVLAGLAWWWLGRRPTGADGSAPTAPKQPEHVA